MTRTPRALALPAAAILVVLLVCSASLAAPAGARRTRST